MEVGEAIRQKIAEGVVKREDIYLVTKVWGTHHDRILEACEASLKKLDLGYIDLYLIHSPVSLRYSDGPAPYPRKENGEVDMIDIDHLTIWAEMEKCVEKGWVKSIGVSNFNSKQVKNIVDNSKIKPVCNQVECSPIANQRKLAKFCEDLGVILTGFSPLGSIVKPEEKKPSYLFDDRTAEIAKKYGKTPAQVILRFSLDIPNVVPIVKSVTKSRIIENTEIFDFKLTKEEMEYLDTFNNFQLRFRKSLDVAKSKDYPYNIEF